MVFLIANYLPMFSEQMVIIIIIIIIIIGFYVC